MATRLPLPIPPNLSDLPDLSEKRIDGEKVFSGYIINVERDKVRLPNGNESEREVVRHPGAAAIVPMLDEQTILLEWQYRYPLGRHIWEIPAGKIDAGENALTAAKRELLEETGYCANTWTPLAKVASAVGFCDEVLSVFIARELRYEGHRGEADEFVHVVKTPLTQALQMLANGDITDAKTIISLLWMERLAARG